MNRKRFSVKNKADPLNTSPAATTSWAIIRTILLLLLVATVILSLILGASVHVFSIFISAYGLVVIPRTLSQIYFSIRNNLRNEHLSRRDLVAYLKTIDGIKLPRSLFQMTYEKWQRKVFALNPGIEREWHDIIRATINEPKKVGVGIPTYRIGAKELEDTVFSILNQTYQPDIIVIGINDPGNNDMIKAAYDIQTQANEYYPHIEFAVLEMAEPGKRGAMKAAFDYCAERDCYYTVNVDGDTQLHQDALYTAIKLIEGGIGLLAITSNVRVRNRSENWLTELTYQRYDYANNRERAAESWFNCVICMSGPLMVMHTESLQELLPAWIDHKFGKLPIGPGDDRGLTAEFLMNYGHVIGYSPASVVWTDCPDTIDQWLKQQLRWIRSAIRYFILSLSWFPRLHPWTQADQLYLMVFPLILGGILGSITAQFVFNLFTTDVTAAFYIVGVYSLIILGVNLFNAIVAVILNRDLRFLESVGYLYLHIRYLLGKRLEALMSLTNNGWGNREAMKK